MYTMYFFTDVLLNPNADSTTVIAKIKEMPRSLFFVTMGYIHLSFLYHEENPRMLPKKSCQLYEVSHQSILLLVVVSE